MSQENLEGNKEVIKLFCDKQNIGGNSPLNFDMLTPAVIEVIFVTSVMTMPALTGCGPQFYTLFTPYCFNRNISEL